MTRSERSRELTGRAGGHIAVRAATAADYPRIAELTLAAYRDDRQIQPGHPYESTLADVAGRAGAGELLVAEDQRTGQVVGSVLLVSAGSRYAELCRPGEAEFRMLAVDPAAQGSGAGQALVKACLDRASARGCTAMVICTRDFAATARRLYQRFGFVRTPERDWTPVAGVNLLALRRDLLPQPLPPQGSPADNGGTTET